jgi:polyferredoxin
MEPMSVIAASFKTPRKKLVKMAPPDHSQALRHALQLGFLALNVWIGIQFYLFVRYYETGGRSAFAARPAGVEGWLPIASLMNLKILLATGRVPGLHAAGMFLLIAFVAISWIFRKGFCAWLCPVGTVSEYLWRYGRHICGHNFRLPRALDIALRSLKYILLGLFLYAVGAMPVVAIRAFLEGPYGMVDDVKMLNFFRFLGLTGGIVMVILVVASVFVQNFWCRYLCPYGALMGAVSAASPLGIRRDANLCIDCGKCARACPAMLPVDRLVSIRSAECTGCLECAAACPVAGALFLSTPLRRRRVSAWVVAAGIAGLFLGICGYAHWTGHWNSDLPSRVYFELIPHANEFQHP